MWAVVLLGCHMPFYPHDASPLTQVEKICLPALVAEPEDNVHPLKLSRLSRAIQAYILEKKIFEAEWAVDVITVRLNMKTRLARIEVIKDIVL